MPCMYRVHDQPDRSRSWRRCAAFLRRPRLSPAPRARCCAPAQFNRVLDWAAGKPYRAAGQRAGPAHPGAGGLQPGQSRPFRPGAAALRAFHLADPPLRRPARPSRADRRPASSARAALPSEAPATSTAIGEHISATERRAARPSATPSTATSPPICATASAAQLHRAASPGSPASACSSALDEIGADGLVPVALPGRSDFYRHDRRRATGSKASARAASSRSATASRCGSPKRTR